MSAAGEDAPEPGRLGIAIIHGITALPVLGWAMALAYALAKRRYEGTTREEQINIIVIGALPVVLWILIVTVSWVLSRRPLLRPAWRVWAFVTAIPLLLFVSYLVVVVCLTLIAALQYEPNYNPPMPHPTDRLENQ